MQKWVKRWAGINTGTFSYLIWLSTWAVLDREMCSRYLGNTCAVLEQCRVNASSVLVRYLDSAWYLYTWTVLGQCMVPIYLKSTWAVHDTYILEKYLGSAWYLYTWRVLGQCMVNTCLMLVQNMENYCAVPWQAMNRKLLYSTWAEHGQWLLGKVCRPLIADRH